MTGPKRLATIDGLRGIAILLVVWFHIWQITWLPAPLPQLEFLPETGFAGVDLFFFISGFVIAYPFLRARAAGAPVPGWRHFAYRRFIKIVPSYVLSIGMLVAAGYAHFSSAGDALRSLTAHLLFVHTWWSSTFGSINGVLWSLAVEVQFYLLFPLVWWCFRRTPYVTAAAMVAISIAYRMIAAHCCLHTTGPQLIDNVPGYLDIFAAGMCSASAYVTLRDRARGPRWSVAGTLVAWAGIGLYGALSQNLYDARFTDMWDTTWQVVNRSGWGVAFFLVATGTLFAAPWWQRAIANPLLLFCAAVSYNWYLYHQAIARGLLALHVPPFSTKAAVDDPHWQLTFTLVAFAVTLAQAAAFTYLFERPLLRLDPKGLLARFTPAARVKAVP
jgi:peptidoglycan/LPS O-acetylase OafA/YrhL